VLSLFLKRNYSDVTDKRKNIKFSQEEEELFETLIQTDIMKYEISSECKANKKLVSEETNANVGFFFMES
jgi:hypothetical protein